MCQANCETDKKSPIIRYDNWIGFDSSNYPSLSEWGTFGGLR